LSDNISICISCIDKVTGLQDYLDEFKRLASEFIIANLTNSGLDKIDPSPCRDLEIPMVFLSKDASHHQSLASAVKKARGEWILMLRYDEMISYDNQRRLKKLCRNPDVSAYYLNTEKRTGGDELSAYEWMGNMGKYSGPAIQRDGHIPCLEIRLFRKNRFVSFQQVSDGFFHPVLNPDIASIPVSDIKVIHRKTGVSIENAVTESQQSEEDWNRFQGIYEENMDQSEDFSFLVRDAIGYSLVDKEDLPSLKSGLDMGLGHVELLKFMIHMLIKDGAYEEAIEFADTVLEKLGDHAELWRLKGAAFFYMLNLEAAGKCLRKALSINSRHANTLSNLAKVYIVSNKFDHAGRLLNKAVDIGGVTPEMEFILNLINENQGQTATLSLLMLCRDEEKNINRALESVKDIVDEIILVDTGLGKNTIDIADEYGAKVIRSEWEDDFGKARNEGLKHVTSDYVFWLDADEFIETDTKMSLLVFKHLLPTETRIGIILDVHTIAEENRINPDLPPLSVGKRTAIFPNLSGLCFKGRVFESVDDSLNRLDIDRIIANKTYITHQNNDTDLRKKQQSNALEKSFSESLSPEMIFEGISYWIDQGNLNQGGKWLEQGIVEGNGNEKYVKIICQLVRYFEQHGYIDVHSRLFGELLSRYAHSYQIMTLCADILCEAGEYHRASGILGKLIDCMDQYQKDLPETGDLRLNRLNFAIANLELDNFDGCDRILHELFTDKEMTDAAQAVVFYLKLKKREVEQAISVLDAWIKDRNLSIKGTIDNFVDLLNVIADVAEDMIRYGQIGASKILTRASEHLAAALTGKE